MEETLGLASRNETLDGDDANAVKVLDSGVSDENPDDGGSVCDEKQVRVDVGSVKDTVSSVDAEKTDAFTEPETESSQMECGGAVEVKPVNCESHQSAGEEETDEKVNCQVEDSSEQNVQTEKSQHSLVDGETLSVAEDKAEQEKESANESHEDSAKMDVDSKEASGENVGLEEHRYCEEEATNVNGKKDNGEAMEIDYTVEEAMDKNVLDTACNESAEAGENHSNVIKEMKEDVDCSANPKSPSEDAATTGNIPLREDKKAISSAEEVASVDCKETLKSTDTSVNAESHDNQSLRADENQEEKEHECLDKKAEDHQDALREENDSIHGAPSMEANQQEDTIMEENPNNSDCADVGAESDIKTNGVKRKADVLSEDSLCEGRKTVSLAKVFFPQIPSFKIGACIARAASHMAGSPSVLKSSNETLSVESFASQLHSAATDPVKENVVSDIATEFFLDFRNSSASQQYTPEKVSSKRGRPSDSNAGGTEAFEFEEMGDTYWTDRVIQNGGEEQTPPTIKENYQVVPVELKPAEVKRTRRRYRRRQSHISIPRPSESDKPVNFDENAPAELIMNFSETDTIPPEKSLSKMFRHFGPIRDSHTEVDKEKNRARVVFRKGADAEVAYKSAGKFNIFGTKAVNYELSFTVTETFKVQPYVVSLGEEEAMLYVPS